MTGHEWANSLVQTLAFVIALGAAVATTAYLIGTMKSQVDRVIADQVEDRKAIEKLADGVRGDLGKILQNLSDIRVENAGKGRR